MGKKFLNKSKGTIGFGDGIKVEPGNVIELDDELLKNKKAAIENLIETGKLIEGTKDKDAPKETEPEEEEPEAEEKPKGEGKKE